MRLLLDTHVWVWSQTLPTALPPHVAALVQGADQAYLSAVSIYEVAQKVRHDRWPGMNIDILDDMIADEENGIVLLPVDVGTHRDAGLLDWSNRDPFDRMIASTALRLDISLVTKDAAFRTVSGLKVLWN